MLTGELITSLNPSMQGCLLVFARVGSVMIACPFVGSRVVPVLVRVWMSLALTIGAHGRGNITLNERLAVDTLVIALGREVLIGLVLGWFAQLVFSGLRLAGHVIEMKCGLGLIQLADPQEGGQTGLFSAFCDVLGGAMFFAINGHHLLLKAVWSSYAVFPLGIEVYDSSLLYRFILSAADIFSIALRVSAPIVVGLCFTEVILGVISRAIPQMNVFMVSQPIQLMFALLLLFLSISGVISVVNGELPRLMHATGVFK